MPQGTREGRRIRLEAWGVHEDAILSELLTPGVTNELCVGRTVYVRTQRKVRVHGELIEVWSPREPDSHSMKMRTMEILRHLHDG